MRKLFFLFVYLLLAQSAHAESVKTLIIEQAEIEYGPELPDKGRFDIRLPDEMLVESEYVSDFWMDRDSGRFIAIVVSETGSSWRINGNAVLVVPVPVVTRQVQPDEIVTSSDLMIIELPFVRVSTFALTDTKDIVGMQVRRVLTKGRPILKQSVIPPVVISRGARVTIQVQSGALSITTQGKSLSDAHLGQLVRVVNIESKKTITGIARGNGLVEIVN